MASPFQTPDDTLLFPLIAQYPGREHQIRSLATLLQPLAAPCRNLVLSGTHATGKSVVVEALLRQLAASADRDGSQSNHALRYAVLSSTACVTARHLYERTLDKVAEASDCANPSKSCETLSQLTVELSRIISDPSLAKGGSFVLVFDAIDRQKEAPPTLIPALARLSEIIPRLTTVFIVTSLPPSSLRAPFVHHVHFPNYSKAEFIRILSATPPTALTTATAEETAELWTRFCGAVHDALIRSAARTLPTLRQACAALWPRFTAPVLAGTHSPREFSKLLIAGRGHFHDQSLVDPGVLAIAPRPGAPDEVPTTQKTPDMCALLPTTARMLLLSAYLASHNVTKHDLTLFSTYYHGKRRRRGGLSGGSGRRSKHRKIARKLLGAHAFALERMMAVFVAVRNEWAAGPAVTNRAAIDGDVGMAISTLSSLRLLAKVGGGDMMDRGGKWRVNVGWELVRALGRSIRVEVEEWLID